MTSIGVFYLTGLIPIASRILMLGTVCQCPNLLTPHFTFQRTAKKNWRRCFRLSSLDYLALGKGEYLIYDWALLH
jgi:hypothetical protein